MILMLGTSTNTKGGVAAVVQSYIDCGLFEEYGIVYLATHTDGSAVKKLWFFLTALLRFTLILAVNPVKIVHIHAASRASFYRKSMFIFISKFFRKKVIFHLHGGEFRQFYHKESSSFGKWFIRKVLRLCDVIIVLSTQWKYWVKGIAQDVPIYIVHNALPVDSALSPKKLSAVPQILFLGRVGEQKGIQDLLAASVILKSKSDFQLKIAGNGDVDKFFQLADSKGLSESVEFLGWIGPEKKKLLLQAADALVLPSYNEGLPMSILEALACGIPVVATNVGGIPDVIEHGKNGYLVEPGDVESLADSLFTVLSDKANYEKMSAFALKKMRADFNVEDTKIDLAAIYASLDSPRTSVN